MWVGLLRSCVALLAAFALSACVAGQSIDLVHQVEFSTEVPLKTHVGLQVTDERPYVKNGEKSPSYIGHYRSGLGNTWDVTTKNQRPLAELVKNDLITDLRTLGFLVSSPEQTANRIKVAIMDWNFDTYVNGKFWYLIIVEGVRSDGQVDL